MILASFAPSIQEAVGLANTPGASSKQEGS
jgi:hypothetical protein